VDGKICGSWFLHGALSFLTILLLDERDGAGGAR
jgi:hypothetical protein